MAIEIPRYMQQLLIYGDSFPFDRFEVDSLMRYEAEIGNPLLFNFLACLGRGHIEYLGINFICDSDRQLAKKLKLEFPACVIGMIYEHYVITKDITEVNPSLFEYSDQIESSLGSLLQQIEQFDYFWNEQGIPYDETPNEWFFQHRWDPRIPYDVQNYTSSFQAWLDEGKPGLPAPDTGFGLKTYLEKIGGLRLTR